MEKSSILLEIPLEYRVLKGQLHIITSEWFPGLYVAGQSEEDVWIEVRPVLIGLIQAKAEWLREKIAERKAKVLAALKESI